MRHTLAIKDESPIDNTREINIDSVLEAFTFETGRIFAAVYISMPNIESGSLA